MPYLANPARYQEMPCRRCGRGITHFDLANNYGPPPGSAETNFGRVLREDFASHLTPARLAQVRRLHDVTQARGQSLAQLALA